MSHGPGFWLPNIVQPIGAVLLGIATSSIALRQWGVANEKFRFDLFEKRFALYQSADAHLARLVSEGDENVEIVTIEALEAIITESRLFFGHAVASSLQDAAMAGRRLYGISRGGIEYRMRPETLQLQSRLFDEILKAKIGTLTVMLGFIDFSESGRPKYFGRAWRLWLALRSRLEDVRRWRAGKVQPQQERLTAMRTIADEDGV